MSPVIYWHRRDLRLADNPALTAAIATGHPVICLYILESLGKWGPGGASRWWLHHSLTALMINYEKLEVQLYLKQGNAKTVLHELSAKTGAGQVFWNRRYDAPGIAIDTDIKASCQDHGIVCHSFNGQLLFEPWTIKNKQGLPFQVFTRFWNTCLEQPSPATPLPPPDKIVSLPVAGGDNLSDWELLPTTPDWSTGLRATWKPGELGAQARLARFMDNALETYKEDRDRPDLEATSMLSPYLCFGEISPRQLWQVTMHKIATDSRFGRGGQHFLSEIGWREFSYHLLFHFPQLPTEPLRPQFAKFPWHKNDRLFKLWAKGQTGYPIIDAGMRQLWHTGWMHNRVRLIVASFLVKDLLLPWQDGEAWFWDTLVDADIANNSVSWQWVAGCGADAAPYFRIFNPVLQGEKFDPNAEYIRQWVPELKDLPNDIIHKPWMASPQRLAAANVYLDKTYPKPIIDHDKARLRALGIFKSLKNVD